MKCLHLSVPFHLEHTLECGQFFQWRKENGGYLIKTGDKIFRIWHNRETLRYEVITGQVTLDFLTNFFRLDDPLDEIFAHWSDDDLLQEAYQKYRGLRIIRQDPWECLVSFVCSMASNIPRITGNIETLSRRFGDFVQVNGEKHYLLPGPAELEKASLDELYDAGIGFRAKYLHRIAPIISNGLSLEQLCSRSYQEAKASLLSFYGIGDKVADCILLFSLEHLSAFPTDTWIMKILQNHYFDHTTKSATKLAALARNHFGEYAGYAQQYLFHYARNDGIVLDKISG